MDEVWQLPMDEVVRGFLLSFVLLLGGCWLLVACGWGPCVEDACVGEARIVCVCVCVCCVALCLYISVVSYRTEFDIMSALTMLARTTARRTAAPVARRTFVSKTAPRLGGMTFETSDTKKFGKGMSMAVTWGGFFFGAGVIVSAVRFQNKKHGFIK